MNMRAVVAAKLATALMFVVLLVAAAVTFLGGARTAAWTAQPQWSHAFANTRSVTLAASPGDQQLALLVQMPGSLVALHANGETAFTRTFSAPLLATTGEHAAAIIAASAAGIDAMNGNGTALWRAPPLEQATQIVAVGFAGGMQVALGNTNGTVQMLGADGSPGWRVALPDAICDLGQAPVGGTFMLVAASCGGTVAVFDAAGQQRWAHALHEPIRWICAGADAIIVAGDAGNLLALRADTGAMLWQTALGQPVAAARVARHTLIIGGNTGGVWAFRPDGAPLWSGSVGAPVAAIAAADVDGDGADEAIIGDAAGGVTLFEGTTGTQHRLGGLVSPVRSMDAGRLAASQHLIVADGAGVQLWRLAWQAAPLWYAPLLAGGALCLLIGVGAWLGALLLPSPHPAEDVAISFSA